MVLCVGLVLHELPALSASDLFLGACSDDSGSLSACPVPFVLELMDCEPDICCHCQISAVIGIKLHAFSSGQQSNNLLEK